MSSELEIRNMTRPEVDELVAWAAGGCLAPAACR